VDGEVVGAPASAGVDLSAPGAAAFSIAPTGPGHYAVSGNAVAAAYVAGTVALVRAYRPQLHQAEVRDRLKHLAEPASGGPDPAQGAGTVDAYAAVAAVSADRQPVSAPVAGPVRMISPPGTPARVVIAGWTASGLLLIGALVLAVRAGRRSRRRSTTFRNTL